MKIAYLSTFYPYRGGIAQFNASLYRAFERQGHDVRAYTFSRQYPELLFPGSSQYASPEDAVDRIPAQRLLDTVNPLSYWAAAREMSRFRPDLLVMKYWMPFFAPSLGTAARRLRAQGTFPLAVLDNVTPHERRLGDAQLNRYFLNSCSGFVSMSGSVQADLLRIRPDAPHFFHPHPLYSHFGQRLPKAEACAKLGIPPGKRVLLFFGLIRPYKGLDLLLQAFKRLDDRYYLVIAGESYEDYAPYRAMLAGHEAEGRTLQQVRYVKDEEVPLLFSAADLCVLPYRSATQSGVVSIAFHFEVPVVVTDVGGLREMVEPYGAGYVVDRPEPALLEQAIADFFEGGNQKAMQGNILDFKERYSWDALASEIASFVEARRGQK
jgi:glycosyltransferase involved in cell wall biosynthesis